MSTLSANRYSSSMKVNRASAYRLLLIVCCLLLTACFLPLYSTSIVIDNKTYSIDTLANYKVGPGTQYTALRLKSNTRLDVFFLKVDATNPYISFKAALGRDSIYGGEQPSAMAKRKSKEGSVYFAGTNGDFYATTGYVGYPVGGCMVESEIARIPNSRYTVSFDQNNIPGIGIMSYSGNVKSGSSTWTINSVNHLREDNKLVLFNQHNGKVTRTNAFGTEVLVQLLTGQTWGVNKTVRVKVVKIEQNKGNMAIPKGYAVLSGHGTAATNLNTLTENAELDITLNMLLDGQPSAYTEMVGGDNRKPMLRNGVVETGEVWAELHPRTGIGYSQNSNYIIFCVVDGRGLSAGVTTKQLAEIMKSAGTHTAFNMDGGGSSAMYVKDFGPMNKTSDGVERSVSNGIFAVSSAPSDNVISEIKSYETTIRLPKFGIFKPKFLGYNQYGMLLNKDVQGVILSCDATLGYINEDGFFVVTGTSNGTLNANYNGVQTTVNIQLVEEAEIAIRLDSLLIDNSFEYPIEVLSVIGLNTMKVLPSALTWTVEHPDICSVDNGVLKGLKNGFTYIIGNLGTFKDTLYVKVEIPTTSRLVQDNFSNLSSWTMTSSSSSWNTTFDSEGLPNNWTHGTAIRYTYKSARSPFIKMTKSMALYSLPDTIKLVLNTGNTDISNLIVGMRANNQTTNVSIPIGALQKEKDIEINIPATQIPTNINDIISFPIWFEYFTLYLNASTLLTDAPYSIYLKEIALRYKNISLGINQPAILSNFRIFPNPTNGKEFTISLSNFTGLPVTVSVYKLNGQLLKTRSFATVISNQLSFPISELASGTYLLSIKQGNKEESVKLIKHE